MSARLCHGYFFFFAQEDSFCFGPGRTSPSDRSPSYYQVFRNMPSKVVIEGHVDSWHSLESVHAFLVQRVLFR